MGLLPKELTCLVYLNVISSIRYLVALKSIIFFIKFCIILAFGIWYFVKASNILAYV